MSKSLGRFPSGSLHSNLCSMDASMRCTIRYANGSPGQIRRPDPNGVNSKWRPLKSTSLFKNLSGKNSSGSVHKLLSRPIAQILMSNRVPLGIS
ncbi:hypothetical protein MUK42_30278 [Musa troglodytarum]|uniref:Uncharacterized protein n=1 Tax=Musa troglodytarum TaxID=320322 RepID=A0A9E7FPD5_9LILI|nr:hypothetical protein MUK42_30278 [Musa troglodytarum]